MPGSYICAEHLPVNPLYGYGFRRVDCIGCRIANEHRKAEFVRYPAYERMYRYAFARMLEARRAAGKNDGTAGWKTADDVFLWWMRAPEFYGQLRF